MLSVRPFKVYDPAKGDPYPEVVYEDVMSKDSAVLQWLENIVSVSSKICKSSYSAKSETKFSNSGYGAFAS